jgi:glycosyltransferase involved in cell wall biosynthesis
MISVLIATHDDERTLGQTLASLVHAAVEGLVREVILADAGSSDGTLAVADDAGARVVRCDGSPEARLAEAVKAARSDWLLILDVAAPAPPGWEEAVASALNGGAGQGLWWGEAPFLGKRRVKGLVTRRQAFEQAGFLASLRQARRLKP